MKNIHRILSVTLLILLVSCNKDFLDSNPKNQYSDAAVWENPDLIRAYVNGIYTKVQNPFGTFWMAALVDETFCQGFWGTSAINMSQITPSDQGVLAPDHWGQALQPLLWDMAYKNIRACNLFFENIDNAVYDNQTEKDQIIGEVTFIRAYLYHWLVAFYGGVPIVTKTFSVSDNFEVPRNTYEECINFITGECDKAAALLPESGDKVKATKGAALTLKSRTLLYAASDFANSGASWAGGYAHPELVSFIGGNRSSRWQAAKAAAKDVIELGIYSLYNANPTSTEDAIKGCQDIFLKYTTDEDILLTSYDYTNGGWPFTYMGQANSPNGWHGWGNQAPIGQFVDAFEMIDGSKFSWSNPASNSAPYENRDPRLTAIVLYNGVFYHERPVDIQGDTLSPGRVQTGYYEQADGTFLGGFDTKDGIDTWNALPIGYYLRKFIDPNVDYLVTSQRIPWRTFRYAEVILNYVEACIETGDEPEARLYLNKIRTRAGMPTVSLSGQALKDEYRNERRIELCFEQHRFFDVRRWMIADEAYTPVEGVDIKYRLLPGGGYGPPEYKKNSITWENREFKNNFYLLPITLAEMNKNSKLVQNPLY